MSKSEIRNSKFETNHKFEWIKFETIVSFIKFSYFEFVSCFGFRASNLLNFPLRPSCHKFHIIVIILIIITVSSCVTSPKSAVNMGDPSTYVKVNFLKGNYDEVIRYSRTLGVLNERSDRLNILYYVGISQLAKKDYKGARESFELLKKRDASKKFQDIADIRIADSYFLDQKYHQAHLLYLPLVSKYPKSDYLPYIYYRLVLTSQKIGDFKQARRYYDGLQKNFPDSLEAIRLSNALDLMDLEGYSVQVGSFSDRNKANTIQSELMQKGYRTVVKKASGDQMTFYRVRVLCNSLREAEKTASQLRLQGYATKVYP
jgi:tetratricopeptide (TPR) repeat protein